VAALGIVMEPSVTVRPPRVAASPVSIECTVHSTNELGDSTVVLGDVRLISVDEDVIVDGHPEYSRLDPLARLGKEEWALHAEVVSVRRPQRPEDIRADPQDRRCPTTRQIRSSARRVADPRAGGVEVRTPPPGRCSSQHRMSVDPACGRMNDDKSRVPFAR
jgi:hypothetical protein